MQRTASQNFAISNQLFATDVYTVNYKEHGKSEKGNILLSPFSVQLVLALTQSGAHADTAEELRTQLHIGNSDKVIRTNISSYLKIMTASNKCKLQSANKIYVQKKFPISNEFKKIATKDFKADVENIDLKSSNAASTINLWVKKQTKEKIRDMVNPETLSSDTIVLLISALYFQARWIHEFQPDATTKANFYVNGSDGVLVDTMNQVEKFSYYESKELKAQFLELPFRDTKMVFVIVLPYEKNGLAALEDNPDRIFQNQRFGERSVHLALPKFRIETDMDFVEILKQMGIRKVFSDEADLSGIGGKKGDLRIGKVLQKASVDVREEGVGEAAAKMVGGTALLSTLPVDFIVDHPFIFYIKAEDVIVFAGRMVDPTK